MHAVRDGPMDFGLRFVPAGPTGTILMTTSTYWQTAPAVIATVSSTLWHHPAFDRYDLALGGRVRLGDAAAKAATFGVAAEVRPVINVQPNGRPTDLNALALAGWLGGSYQSPLVQAELTVGGAGGVLHLLDEDPKGGTPSNHATVMWSGAR